MMHRVVPPIPPTRISSWGTKATAVGTAARHGLMYELSLSQGKTEGKSSWEGHSHLLFSSGDRTRAPQTMAALTNALLRLTTREGRKLTDTSRCTVVQLVLANPPRKKEYGFQFYGKAFLSRGSKTALPTAPTARGRNKPDAACGEQLETRGWQDRGGPTTNITKHKRGLVGSYRTGSTRACNSCRAQVTAR